MEFWADQDIRDFKCLLLPAVNANYRVFADLNGTGTREIKNIVLNHETRILCVASGYKY